MPLSVGTTVARGSLTSVMTGNQGARSAVTGAAEKSNGELSNMPPTPVRALPPAIESLRYLARARQFRRAAIMHVDMENGEPFWPKWFLVTHALELAIKAYI